MSNNPQTYVKDVHTEHCCKKCGCKYGEGQPVEDPTDPHNATLYIRCSVVSGEKPQSYPCDGDCFGLNWGYDDP